MGEKLIAHCLAAFEVSNVTVEHTPLESAEYDAESSTLYVDCANCHALSHEFAHWIEGENHRHEDDYGLADAEMYSLFREIKVLKIQRDLLEKFHIPTLWVDTFCADMGANLDMYK